MQIDPQAVWEDLQAIKKLSPLVHNITNLVKYRHQASVGGFICVNGFLGDSGGGLKALQENKAKTAGIRYLLQSHFRPNPDPLQDCLLVTISPTFLETIQLKFQKKFQTPLFPIGRITDDPNKLEYCRYGETIQINYKNFDHFE